MHIATVQWCFQWQLLAFIVSLYRTQGFLMMKLLVKPCSRVQAGVGRVLYFFTILMAKSNPNSSLPIRVWQCGDLKTSNLEGWIWRFNEDFLKVSKFKRCIKQDSYISLLFILFRISACNSSYCNNHGFCNEKGKCICDEGWTGSHCSSRLCCQTVFDVLSNSQEHNCTQCVGNAEGRLAKWYWSFFLAQGYARFFIRDFIFSWLVWLWIIELSTLLHAEVEKPWSKCKSLFW